jgi:outer membrane receptor protein involved in Fe transport
MSLRALLLASSVIALSATSVQAQTSQGDDEVIVTGSRIPQDPNIVGAVPVQSIDREDFLLSGELNLADVVSDIPALISSTTSENSLTGANALNLRGLGDARSLTLVNGRRHVAGFRGSSAVDIGSIPQALVERVEVSTGGASAIYGADAVTGVVNFILKDDYEGADFNLRGGVSTEGDAENFSASAVFGKNFDHDRGNVTITGSYTADSTLRRADREWARVENFRSAVDNPDLLFQTGDITSSTPALAAFYDYNGFSPIVLRNIPSQSDFVADYTNRFGVAPNLNASEIAILERANAPLQALVADTNFWLSSQQGSIIPGDFGNFGDPAAYFVDVNGNGLNDCEETGTGQQISNFLAGCWVVDESGQVRLFNDALFLNGAEGAGGDGARQDFNSDFLIPKTEKYDFNFNANYDLAPNLTIFMEAKYVFSETETFDEYDQYYDTLFVASDNPYIPQELQALANASGGLRVTQDAAGWNDDSTTYERETIRLVGGLKWQADNGLNFEISGNHGRFTRADESAFELRDRYFAAIDAVDDGNGNIVCRSELDPTAIPNNDEFFSTYSIGSPYVPGFYTFTPGQGDCAPLNIFGANNVSEAAKNFIAETAYDEIEITQTVLSGIVSGEIDQFQSLLDGGIGFAAGVEYRRETSESNLNIYDRGIIPEGSPLPAGVPISSLVPGMNSFNFDNDSPSNTQGSYDVKEVFGEIRLPIFVNQPFAKEFTIDGAVRYADYSTSGGNSSWKVGSTWSPITELSLRGTYSRAVRAPNISELFDPRLPITVNASDEPCVSGNIAASLDPALRQANCAADLLALGVPNSEIFDANGDYIWRNPLTARFGGVSGGSTNLTPEIADTFTIGAVIRPASLIENLSITLDYWDIQIDEAIGTVSTDDIFAGCYDREVQEYCDLFSRVTDATAPTFGGLIFIDSSSLNFARIEANGLDFAVNYSFDVGEYVFGASLVGTRQFNLDRFFNPLDLTDVDPELNEIQRPELSGNLTLSVAKGPWYLGLQTSYQSKQAYGEVETLVANWGDGGWTDDSYIFDVNASYEINDGLSLYGGVNNVSDEVPFAAQLAWPVSPRGRFVFMGVNAQF